ncbi:MAG: 3-deoxy-7-phosphoheptulonate synthase [Candidatus Gracilibacteria bacterium]|nr:3-deoxy-7-phosphoheptulonate synthase [Candidatus Gracilibacteria bacterium]
MKKIKSPVLLKMRLLADEKIQKDINNWRLLTSEIINKNNNRLLVVVGPCSIHDVEEGLVYARKLNRIKEKYPNLFIVMRSYFEKPRTINGWKGLINDPFLDGSFDIEKGLKKARKLLLEINKLGLAVSTEFLDPITPNYLSDLITWGAIGARTTESQVHREMASGLDSIIGFKNGTTGDIQIAIDAIKSSANSHTFLGINQKAKLEIINTKGNKNTHIILRGGKNGPNYKKEDIDNTIKILKKEGINTGIVIDASHANSNKKPENQKSVIKNIAEQIENGNKNIIGVMIESNIYYGSQPFTPGVDKASDLKYGISITDGCIALDDTKKLLDTLNKAVEKRKTLK